MGRIEALVSELCPGGIEYRRLGDLGVWRGGGTPSKQKAAYWQNGTIPWLSPKDMGDHVLVDTIDRIAAAAIGPTPVKLIPPNSVAVVVRSSILDRTFPVAFVPFATTLNQDMKALVPHDNVLAAYIAHTLTSFGDAVLRACRKTGGSVASIEVPKLLNFRVPIPPLEIQREIVKVLDSFARLETELETALQTELDARWKQYQYYRDALLGRSESASPHSEWRSLGEVGKFTRGRRFTNKDFVQTGIGCIHYGEIYTHYGLSATKTKSFLRPELAATLRMAKNGDLIVAGTGESVEEICKAVAWLGDDKVAVHDDCYIFAHSLDPKFAAYVFTSSHFNEQKVKYAAGAKMIRVSSDSLEKIRIPVPTLEDQQSIVAVLDQLDATVSGLSVKLPDEIKARRQQYEYFRDRLLTFREAA